MCTPNCASIGPKLRWRITCDEAIFRRMKIPWRRTILSLAFVAPHRAAPRIGLGAYRPFGFVKIQRSLMGTLWGIEVIDHGRPEEARQAIDSAYAELARIEDLMSEWKPESPISQVDAAAGLHPVKCPPSCAKS
jgi:thiamine biosynthesis lipoprotein ApbE